MKLLPAALLSIALAAPAAATEPGHPLLGLFPGARLDDSLSQPFYPILEGGYSRIPLPGETPAQAAKLEATAREALTVYLSRVSNMVGGMNLPDEARQPYCQRMLGHLSDRFIHIEGRRRVTAEGAGGFAVRTKAQLATACQGRAFRLSGFYAVRSRVVALDENRAQATTCYFHDQWNDPAVQGTTPLANGRRAVWRASVETLERERDGVMRIVLHVALDSDETLVTRGCAVQ